MNAIIDWKPESAKTKEGTIGYLCHLFAFLKSELPFARQEREVPFWLSKVAESLFPIYKSK